MYRDFVVWTHLPPQQKEAKNQQGVDKFFPFPVYPVQVFPDKLQSCNIICWHKEPIPLPRLLFSHRTIVLPDRWCRLCNERQYDTVVKDTDSGATLLGFEAWLCHCLAMWLWTSSLSCLCAYSFICTVGVNYMYIPHEVVVKINTQVYLRVQAIIITAQKASGRGHIQKEPCKYRRASLILND